jgi:hypothetical protein
MSELDIGVSQGFPHRFASKYSQELGMLRLSGKIFRRVSFSNFRALFEYLLRRFNILLRPLKITLLSTGFYEISSPVVTSTFSTRRRIRTSLCGSYGSLSLSFRAIAAPEIIVP